MRMVFGLANGPSGYQRLITQALRPLVGTTTSCYLDCIIIAGKDFQEIMRKLDAVLNAIGAANLTLRLQKCTFGTGKIEYLEFVLTNDEIQPGRKKVSAIERFRTPASNLELRRFLGLTGFFRGFVKHSAYIAAPLHKLQNAGNDFVWTD